MGILKEANNIHRWDLNLGTPNRISNALPNRIHVSGSGHDLKSFNYNDQDIFLLRTMNCDTFDNDFVIMSLIPVCGED